MLTEQEKQFLRADLAQVRRLLAEGRAHQDPIAEHQYMQRVEHLQKKLAELSQAAEQAL